MTSRIYRLMSTLAPRPMPRPKLDVSSLISSRDQVLNNMSSRGHEDLECVDHLINLSKEQGVDSDQVLEQALLIPNATHEAVKDLKEPKVIRERKYEGPFNIDPVRYGEFREIRNFDAIGTQILHNVRTNELSVFNGDRTYFLIDGLARLERALIRFVVQKLVKEHGFKRVSVPDLLHPDVVKGCGMAVEGKRTQVYHLSDVNLVLSGTAEMAMAGMHIDQLQSDLPRRLLSVSRCFRAETSERSDEKGIYRVRHFTKVEMFITSKPDESEVLLNEIVRIQSNLFSELNLAFRILEMPPHELGLPANRKFDIEAFLPGSNRFGEISSASNCTDYQARRMNICYEDKNKFCHTLNGTACAIPRTIMAICEQFQLPNGLVAIPEVLRPFMDNDVLLQPERKKSRPHFKFVRSPHAFHQ